jgi:hypothetical protein
VNITVKPTRVYTTVKVETDLKGAPEHKADYISRRIVPDRAIVTYRYHEQMTEDGWTQHRWLAMDVKLTGYRILKPAADGSQRLGVDRHEACWYTVRTGADLVADKPELPAWVAELIQRMRPSGELVLPTTGQ